MTEIPERLSAALADRYRIERHLGEGGMANVYLAEDLRHQRKVAVKVLRPELAAVLGAERFIQEITTTAGLQHPHILPLFDSGEARVPPLRDPERGTGGEAFLFYVMPFIDGETLRDKLDRETQLGIDDAVRITTEVAEALDYAHRQGVIHRDIKPENILLHEGRPMVADFGIALAVSAAAGGRMTETGLSLGTPHYMSPEQATAEKNLTNRSDIYSLGAVLYEMLTGDPPHTGSSAQQIIMKIVTDEARSVTDLRKSVPANVSAAVAKSLEKLPADRFATAARFAEALADPAFVTSGSTAIRSAAVRSTGWEQRWAPRLLAITALAIAAAVWGWLRSPQIPPRPVSRYSVALPDSEALGHDILPRIAALPDGSGLVYKGVDGRLLLRHRNALHAVPIAGTDNAYSPFVAPDSRHVGFVVLNPSQVIVTSLDGGETRNLWLPDQEVLGLSWGSDGYVYAGGWEGLVRIPSAGGAPETITELQTEEGETGHASPSVVEGTGSVLFTVLRGSDPTRAVIAVTRPGSGRHQVIASGTRAWHARSGHLLYMDASGELWAAGFDGTRITGEAVRMATGLRSFFPGAELALSNTGDLAYVTGAVGQAPDDVVWVTRDGNAAEVVPGWTEDFSSLALSPDGNRLAITVRDPGGRQIWIRDLGQGSLRRLTVDGTLNSEPAWTADGRTIFFASVRARRARVYGVAAAGGANPEPVLEVEGAVTDLQVAPNGAWLVLRSTASDDPNILAFRPGTDTVPVPIAAMAGVRETAPRLSPDGNWLVYASDETGRNEVYVRPFPGEGGRQQVSLDGGEEPRWARSGREIFYRNGANRMTAVTVEVDSTIVIGTRQELFDWGMLDDNRWDVEPGDERFVFVRTRSAPSELIVVENFFEELKAKVGS